MSDVDDNDWFFDGFDSPTQPKHESAQTWAVSIFICLAIYLVIFLTVVIATAL